MFGLNGLVKQANPAAKEILGFRSLSGMSPEDIFRSRGSLFAGFRGGSDGPADSPVRLVEEVHAVLREGSKQRQLEADYATPAGEKTSPRGYGFRRSCRRWQPARHRRA